MIRGATQQILDEAERSMHDALCVLSQTVKETRTVLGGGEQYEGVAFRSVLYLEPPSLSVGCSEMLMAHAVSQLAEKTPGKEAIAIESFVRALKQVCVVRVFFLGEGGGGTLSFSLYLWYRFLLYWLIMRAMIVQIWWHS